MASLWEVHHLKARPSSASATLIQLQCQYDAGCCINSSYPVRWTAWSGLVPATLRAVGSCHEQAPVLLERTMPSIAFMLTMAVARPPVAEAAMQQWPGSAHMTCVRQTGRIVTSLMSKNLS